MRLRSTNDYQQEFLSTAKGVVESAARLDAFLEKEISTLNDTFSCQFTDPNQHQRNIARFLQWLRLQFNTKNNSTILNHRILVKNLGTEYVHKSLAEGLLKVSLDKKAPEVSAKINTDGDELLSFLWRRKKTEWTCKVTDNVIDYTLFYRYFDLENSNGFLRWDCPYNLTNKFSESDVFTYESAPVHLDWIVEDYFTGYKAEEPLHFYTQDNN